MLEVPSLASGGSLPLKDTLGDMVSKIRENLSLKRGSWVAIQPSQQALTSYVHGSLRTEQLQEDASQEGAGVSMHLGSQCTLSTFSVSTSALAEDASLKSRLHKLNMHITAAKPKYHYIEDVPEDVVAHEKDIITKQLGEDAQKKPAQVLEKIVTGKLQKFYQEVVLNEQLHLLSEESNLPIKKELEQLNVTLEAYVRWQVGEEEQ
jgi:elongation factor Ts